MVKIGPILTKIQYARLPAPVLCSQQTIWPLPLLWLQTIFACYRRTWEAGTQRVRGHSTIPTAQGRPGGVGVSLQLAAPTSGRVWRAALHRCHTLTENTRSIDSHISIQKSLCLWSINLSFTSIAQYPNWLFWLEMMQHKDNLNGNIVFSFFYYKERFIFANEIQLFMYFNFIYCWNI